MPFVASRPARRWTARLARRTARLAAPLALAAAAGACGDATSPEASVAGTYALVAYENRAVPTVLASTPGVARVEIVDGELDLRADRRFTIEVVTRDVDLRSGVVTDDFTVASGSYAVRGGTITFSNTTDGDLDGEQAAVAGSTVTFGPLTFRR